MELWEVMDWGDEPLPMKPDIELFVGIKRSIWESKFHWWFPRDYLTEKFVDEDGNISEKEYLEIKNGELISSLSFYKILDHSTIEVSYSKPNNMCMDAIPRNGFNKDNSNTIYEMKFNKDEFERITWEKLDFIDRRNAVQCLLLAGALESCVVKYIFIGHNKYRPLKDYLFHQNLKTLLITPWLPPGSEILVEKHLL